MERERLKKIDRKRKKVVAKQPLSRMSPCCGTENPGSLKCIFYVLEGDEIATVIRPKELHQGHVGLLHGGYTASVLDETMGRANWRKNENGIINPYVTANMEISYMKPAKIGETYYVFGRVDREDGKKNFNSAEILDADGNVYAMAEALFINASKAGDGISEKVMIREELEPLSDDDPKEL